jgi:hypothetical protein
MSVPMRWQQPVEPIEPQKAEQRRTVPQRQQSARRARRTRVNGAMFMLMTVCACAAVGLRFTGWQVAQQHGLTLVQTQSGHAQVALTGSSIERNLGFVTVTGNVQNRAAHSLAHTEAVVELLDAQNRAVGVESALIGQDSLAPHETASFRVEMEDNHHAVGYRIHFRKLLGSILN